MPNYYADAIDILQDPNLDAKKVLVEIAKRRPKVVIDAARPAVKKKTPRGELTKLERECLDIIKTKGAIEAIKYHRLLTGTDLKASKLFVEKILSREEK